MTVYIEYVFCYNLIIDLIILKATLTLNGIRAKKGRLFLCAFFLALIPFLPFLNFNKYLCPTIKVCLGLFFFNLFFRYKKQLKLSLTFIIITVIFGGVSFFISSVFGIDSGNNLFLALLPLVFLVSFYVIKRVYFSLKRSDGLKRFIVKVKIKVGKVVKDSDAIIDTGNGSYYKNEPIIFCSKSLGRDFLSQLPLPRTEKVLINSVNGENTFPVIKSDFLTVIINGNERTYKKVWVCISRENLGADFDVILHPELNFGDK